MYRSWSFLSLKSFRCKVRFQLSSNMALRNNFKSHIFLANEKYLKKGKIKENVQGDTLKAHEFDMRIKG